MRPKFFLAIVALACFGLPSGDAQDPTVIEKLGRELSRKRLQGYWVPDLIVTAEGAERYPLAGRGLFFENGDFTKVEGNRTVASGSFKVEDGYLRLTVKESCAWDLEAAPVRDKVQYAIRIDGDLLTLCYSVGDKGRAHDLAPGEGRMVVVYKLKPLEATLQKEFRAPDKR